MTARYKDYSPWVTAPGRSGGLAQGRGSSKATAHLIQINFPRRLHVLLKCGEGEIDVAWRGREVEQIPYWTIRWSKLIIESQTACLS